MRGVLVFNETGNGHRREAGCQHRVTAPSQFLSHIHKSPQVLKISLSMGPSPPKKKSEQLLVGGSAGYNFYFECLIECRFSSQTFLCSMLRNSLFIFWSLLHVRAKIGGACQ